ncbi:helix-turn-helix transcriptional regulator [Allokutzneria oryzae]|uniref:AAA family ATPase n=1 Tax=Allokutzneria oryzae TaxID=1378989 RepID=A0ABV6A7A1_9PSEU
MLVGRARELSMIDSVLTGSTLLKPGSLLIEGPAGIGKSALLTAARSMGNRAGYLVLSASASEVENDFAFGVVRQLFDPVVLTSESSPFVGPAQHAATVFAADALGYRDAEAGFARMHGLFWLAVNLAAERPVLILVDDVQWADAPSLRWLGYLLRRMTDLPITVVLAKRSGDRRPSGSELEDVLARLAERIGLTGLDSGAVADMGSAYFADAAEPGFWDACLAATGGNPFLLKALFRSCASAGMAPVADSGVRIMSFGPPEVASIVRRELRRVGSLADRLVTALAVLGDTTDLDVLAAVADVEPDRAADLVRALVGGGILVRERNSVRFAHSIIGAALLADGELAEAGESLNASAARVLAERGAAPERVAAHLLRAAPVGQPWAAQTLKQAADEALRRGAPDSAVSYLHRVLQEPCSNAERATLSVEVGRAEANIDLGAAIEHLRAGMSLSSEPRDVAAVAVDLARALCAADQQPAAVALLDRVRRELAPHEPELAAQVEGEWIGTGLLLLSSAPDVLAHLKAAGADGAARRRSFQELMQAHSRQETIDYATETLRALAGAGDDGASSVLSGSVAALAAADEFSLALAHCDAAIDRALARGAVLSYAALCAQRAEVHARMGRIPDWYSDAQVSLDARVKLGLPLRNNHALVTIGQMVSALVHQARLDEADRLLGRADLLGEVPEHLFGTWTLISRARLKAARGDLRAGLADYLECGRRLLQFGLSNPAVAAWRSEAALLWHRSGETTKALDLVEEELDLARAWGAPKPIGVALRELGLIKGGPSALALLAESRAVLKDSPCRLQYALSTAAVGVALRDAGHVTDAREQFRSAIELAYHCGAVHLAQEVEADLRASGGRPSGRTGDGVAALTPSERRVAALAAQGRTNRQIAEQLFVGLRTVEIHLTNAYRKLAISGRADLPEVFACEPTAVL